FALVSFSAATAAAGARERRVRLRGRGTHLRTRLPRGSEGRVSSFLRPFLFGERDPFALFNLTDQRGPRFRLRVECELVRQLISKLELKGEKLVIELAATELGILCPEDVDPMTNIILRRVIKADEDERFVFRLRVGRAVVKFDELM